MENMLRRGESSWLCMKFEFAFFAGHGILLRVLPPSFLALTVKEVCFILILLNPFATACFVLHVVLLRFSSGISIWFWAVVRFPAFGCMVFLLRFPCESSCFLLHFFLMRFAYEISCFLTLMRFPCEISCFFNRYEISP